MAKNSVPAFLFTFISLFIVANVTVAKPVLIAVRLDGTEQIRAWQNLAIPTYAFVSGLAIAEADDILLPDIDRQGFDCAVWDDRPWTADYYYGRDPDTRLHEPLGKVVYQDGDFYILKAGPDKKNEILASTLRPVMLDRRPLTARFWEQATRKIIGLNSLPWDPVIQNLVDQVNPDSITANIQRLQDFKSRLFLLDSCYAAEEWLRQRFNGWGYPVEFDSFYLTLSWPRSGWDRNVIATKTGDLIPTRLVIVCGHHDCIVWPDSATARVNAPGADDNGTGIAGTMEIARIFRNYGWEPTFKFVGWAAEEMGLYGSHHYAAWADSQNLDIQAVINLDMIGFMNDTTVDCNIDSHGSFTAWLSNLVKLAGQVYVPTLLQYEEVWSGGSDDLPFYQHGFSSSCNIERWYNQNPNYHKVTDLITATSPLLYAGVTKACLAAAAVLGLYPGIVQNVAAYDFGDGQRLRVDWAANPEGDVIGYRIYWGRQSGSYPDSTQTSGLTDTLAGLLTDSLYYITVRALDLAGHLSPLAVEVAARPRFAPIAPRGIQAQPILSGIRVDWQRNTELDLAGYRIYRRINQNPVYDSLITAYLTDSFYTDQPLSGADKYYYALRAFDLGGNPSPLSGEVYGRPITLDQGILAVDETRDSPSLPDSLQDRFYDNILIDYPHHRYDYDSAGQKPVLADLVPYSSVVWHSDDMTDFLAAACVTDLRSYLNAGGKLWFTGWKPSADLRDTALYPADFVAGDFIYDFFKIAHADISTIDDSFQAATGNLGYPTVSVDPVKVPDPGWAGTMRYIEALTAATPGEIIYTMDMRNSSSPFEGKVCGIRYLGGPYRTVYFGFPLYYMNQTEARLVAQKVMQDFGEQAVKEFNNRLRITMVRMLPNKPNPFASVTLIRYQLPYPARVNLKIYTTAGQLVKTIVNRDQDAGSYEVSWNGKDDNGRSLASGIYFYHLSTERGHATGKMLIVR